MKLKANKLMKSRRIVGTPTKASALMKLKPKSYPSGFSLIELMVSVAIFSVAITIGLMAILNQNATFKKTQHMREINNNLAFVMEEMSRHLRLGSNYRCDSTVSETPLNCSDGDQVSFEYVYGIPGDVTDQWVYEITSINGVQKKKGSGIFQNLTPAEVVIDSGLSGFTVDGSEETDNKQPRVIIRLAGYIIYKNDRTSFNIQTTVSQRLLDS